jgi:capsular polysaccharide biosynthesis protein
MTELTQANTENSQTPLLGDLDGAHAHRISAWEAMKRHWVRAILPVVILVPIAIVIGLGRSPKYTSETHLIVGRLSITNPGLAGFVTATQSLAAAYARAVTASAVTEPVGKELGITPKQVASRLEGSPIQLSPVFRVIAHGASAGQAVALANDTSNALISYVSSLNRENPDGPNLLKRFRAASKEFSSANLEMQSAQDNYDHSQTEGNRRALDAAVAVRAQAELEKNTFGVLYTGSEAGQSTASLVSTLNPATTATSDRGSVTQMLVLVAIIAGLVIGLALATARARRGERHTAA